ncbi:MAG: 50S ribosomal protein L20 [Candidatus Magasanikbacteria bacterium]|nr:50S ribosomal protein L20 [Candidatus Magasanikbacteria bacterium]
MSRVKRGTQHVKRRKSILKRVKGFKYGRKKLLKLAKTADTKAGAYAYRDRRNKKREMRRLWTIRINAALKEFDMSYSKFIGAMKTKNILIDRKVLSEIADKKPEVFKSIVEATK